LGGDIMGSRAFTLVEAIVLITIVVVGIVVALWLPGRMRHGCGRQMQNSSQVRGIHSGMVLYAAGNNGYYPGLDAYGGPGESANNDSALTVENRFRLLLEDNYFDPGYIISPDEKKAVYDGIGMLTRHNYSYALSVLTGSGERINEWRDTTNSEAVVISDRAISTKYGLRSIHTRNAAEGDSWRGSVGFNDNHVQFEADEVLPTNYGGVINEFDSLFEVAGQDDAAMACQGTDDLID